MKLTSIIHTMLCFLLAGTVAVAQKAEAPDFRYDTGAKINDMTLTQGGTMVVATNDGLVGIKPGSNDLLFNFTDYGRVKPEELSFIPFAPYVVVAQGGFAGISSKKAVIDYISGKKLFSTEDNGWKMATTVEVYMPQNKLIVAGQRKAKEKYASQVAMYDLNTGAEDFRFNLVDPGKVTMKSFTVTGRPLLLKDRVLVPTSQGVLSKTHNGDTQWDNKLKNVHWMVANESETDIYAFVTNPNKTNTKIYKLGSNNGQELWKDEAKVKGVVTNFEILPQGLAVVSNTYNEGKSVLAGRSESKIAMLSATNGEDLWDKAPKTKGYVQHFYIMDDGILFGIQQGGINKISYDGKTLFKKPLKTGENILTMAETEQGLIYITSSDANIVNMKTGETVWKKPLKYKRADAISSTFDTKNNRYLISADEQLYAIDAASGNVEEFAKTKFEGKESPTGVDVRNGGILLTSDQNLTMLDWDGKETWHGYYKAPGKSAFGAILAGVTAVASAAGSMAAANSSIRNRIAKYDATADREAELAGGLAAASGASVAEMLKRFKATAATANAQFILTKLDDGVGLVKINKDTGAKEKEIVLKDKKPEYQVDDRGGILYYKADNNTIFAYDLTK
ncbi:outer membrane protein assembly factor BamB family protein [Marinirhabdus gelatinilytica]|uniref:Putative pyrroloquinoline-quinone binding quinoprotein n=1 Tax=Marinirhabdus gelatinilytica TaxID=1703343 RepID=A0A370QLJ4_9FLAO|nr:PQQ-binding-like beta-propeller repeat protein [Marinirhabdus gelatinilytica]RDK89235.1 putative pyrroloquinoline-quinone binding quinoprotein [Marinirhabdus gelatinilytica]